MSASTPAAACIAIVDDDETVRRASARLLRAAGFNVDTFPSGAEFLASLQGRRPDCLMLDLHMPEMDGFAVVRGLAKAGHVLPVIIVTGHDTAEDCERAKTLGVYAFLRKPIDGGWLIATIRAAIATA